MIVSIKDTLRLLGISIVCFCAAFVCTFFLNYYIDVLPLGDSVPQELMPLYTAQLATARMTCAITGGFLAVIAVIMLIFYVKLYIDSHSKLIGTIKAMGYSNFAIAKSFMLFGASAFLGCAAGFCIGWASMKKIYELLTIDGLPEIAPAFHGELLAYIVILPSIVFTLIAFIYASLCARRPALSLMKGTPTKYKTVKPAATAKKERPFLTEMCLSVLKSKKSLVFFVLFSCFCFSAMVQMGWSMENLMSGTMGFLILAIGIILSVVSLLMAMTSLIKHNSRNIAIMKAMGYSKIQTLAAIFAGFIPFMLAGFAIGTAYQYGLLSLMINLIFKNVSNVPDYSFSVPIFFYTLLLFVVWYGIAFVTVANKSYKSPIKEIMLET